MKLQAVMENLQRQQRARLQQEREAPPPPPSLLPPAPSQTAALLAPGAPTLPRGPSQNPLSVEEMGDTEPAGIQRAQMAALAAMRAAAAGLGQSTSPAASSEESHSQEEQEEEEEEEEEDGHYLQEGGSEEEEMKGKWSEDFEEDMGEEEEEEEDYEEDEEMAEEAPGSGEAARSSPGPQLLRKQPPLPQYRGEPSRMLGGHERFSSSVTQPGLLQVHPQGLDHGDWTYEEQFKQLYELDGDPKRKEFLDDLFSFMQKRGTPVNRIPIMAKQVLDLYMLYILVTEKGGLVEVINKKLWREITKGLNLPTSITSAAFTLRTQYMKYLYPYECEKRGLSSPNELQAAIDSNRREGRRQGFSGSIFTYSPSGTHTMLPSPQLQVPAMGMASATNGSPMVSVPKIKKEEDNPIPIAVPSHLPVSLAGHPVVAAQAAAAAAQAAAQAAVLEHLREKLESGEPPEKKSALVSDEQCSLVQRAFQQNLLAMTAQLPMSIRINSQETCSPENRQDAAMNLTTNGTNSISMSVELNGILYTGMLFAQTPGAPSSLGKGAPTRGRSSGGPSSGPGGPTSGVVATPQAGLPCAPTSTSTSSSSP
ncbi:AT-rich interactive domain-containing protein 3A [Varanus komodoensis]|uniref:AT-rich interactive domain-containing protein 3A n=1 Tax=Varanus komodoensis TaxID=61221 RepID=UPI001CF7D061|nr:AT-rich interactive domain-containing protein 3A [Varanus komodoensis]